MLEGGWGIASFSPTATVGAPIPTISVVNQPFVAFLHVQRTVDNIHSSYASAGHPPQAG